MQNWDFEIFKQANTLPPGVRKSKNKTKRPLENARSSTKALLQQLLSFSLKKQLIFGERWNFPNNVFEVNCDGLRSRVCRQGRQSNPMRSRWFGKLEWKPYHFIIISSSSIQMVSDEA